MKFAGIDYSIGSPSITIGTLNDFKMYGLSDTKKYIGTFNNINISQYPTWKTDIERYNKLSDWALSILNENNVTHVCIEGYSMASTGKVFNLAENTAILKYKLHNLNIPFITPAPTAVKKTFTGKGNSNKEVMVNTFIEKTKIDIIKLLDAKNFKTGPVNDLCDSYAMLDYIINIMNLGKPVHNAL